MANQLEVADASKVDPPVTMATATVSFMLGSTPRRAVRFRYRRPERRAPELSCRAQTQLLKIDRTSGALLGIVRLLDATLLPEKQPWEWRQDVHDRILWRARTTTPVPASAEWLQTAHRRDTVLLYGPLDAGATRPADWERLVSVHAYCQFTDRM